MGGWKRPISTLVRIKQRVNTALINSGLRNPGSKDRHNWVGPGYHMMKREFQMSFLLKQGLRPEHSLLDLGCGTLRGGIPLIEFLDEGNYCGIDVRPRVLAEARKELAEHGLEHKVPQILLMSDAKSEVTRRFDFIWAFQVFIHMNDEKIEEAFRFSADRLIASGVMLATATIGELSEREWQGFPFLTRPLSIYEDQAARVGMTIHSLGTLDSLEYSDGSANPSNVVMLEFRFI